MPHRTLSPTPAIPSPAVSALPEPDNPRVQVISSSPGTVHLVGVTVSGDWVAEYKCLAEDFDAREVARMERRVREKERHLPARVLEFPPRI